MNLDDHGAAHLAGAAAPFLAGLDALAAGVRRDKAGTRLRGTPGLAALLAPEMLGGLAPGMRPVRAILFDKNPAINWALGWHQDRTIPVAERVAVPGFGPWSIKQGLTHVQPPFALIERMRTIRIHLDPVPADNAPLMIAPGSHRLGRIVERDLAETVARCGMATCLADAGDVWLYATPILHASAAATRPARRRVLQVDFSRDDLPAPLRLARDMTRTRTPCADPAAR